MKKIYTWLTVMFAVLCLGLTSCDDDYYGPPGVTYDRDLIGTWQLYSADGVRVYDYQVNWLEFRPNGRGTYYYYQNGLQYSMWLNYSVNWYAGGQELYISYEDGRDASMDYWFNSNYTFLYTQWYDRGYRHTYVYQFVDGPDWAPMQKQFKQAPANTSLPSLTPGLSNPETPSAAQ